MSEIRRACPSDVQLIYEWANDESVRKNSFQSQKIVYEEHCAWYAKKLSNPNVVMYVLEENGVPVAQIRYEISDGVALIGYSVAAQHRGKGFGKQVIAKGEEALKEQYDGLKGFLAYVKKSNLASMAIFQKLGYTEEEEEEQFCYKKDNLS